MSAVNFPGISQEAAEFKKFDQKIINRFWEKVKFTKKCWIWIASKKHGYGQFFLNNENRSYSAPKFSYELLHGEIPKSYFVCHHCDNPSCVNPSHLFLGSHLDNMRDMKEKGRDKLKFYKHANKNKGSQCCNAKLGDDDVRQIKKLLKKKVPQKDIAKEFQVSKSAISTINIGKSWSHIK